MATLRGKLENFSDLERQIRCIHADEGSLQNVDGRRRSRSQARDLAENASEEQQAVQNAQQGQYCVKVEEKRNRKSNIWCYLDRLLIRRHC